jgi:hypothetical protein
MIVTGRVRRSSRLRRTADAVLALSLVALTSLFASPARSAPLVPAGQGGRPAGTLAAPPSAPAAHAAAQSDDLLGTWQVTRTCVSGCTGTTTLSEVVRAYNDSVDMATSSVTILLYRITRRKVLTHAAASSSLLTIRVPGQLMDGPAIGQDGSTLRTTWRCVAAPAALSTASSPGSDRLWPHIVTLLRGIC